MIVDVRTHLWPSPEQLGPAVASTLRRRARGPMQVPDATPEAYAQAMGPVRRAVLHGLVSRSLGINITLMNLQRWAGSLGEKVLLSAGIDPLADDSLEAVAAAAAAKCIGVTVNPAASHCHPTHSRAMRVYEACEHHGLVLFVHQGGHLVPQAPLAFDQAHLFDEVAAGFPALRIVISRVGQPWIEPTLSLLTKHAHVYADLAELVALPWQLYNTLVLARQQGVMDKLLPASGFPVCTPQDAITTLYSINSLTHGTHLPSVPREQIRRIVEVNAIQALGLRDEMGNADATGPQGSAGPADGITVQVDHDAIVQPHDSAQAEAANHH